MTWKVTHRLRSSRRQIRDIDSEEFGMVFEQHANGIYNLCFRSTGDWSLAHDLTAVVFLEAWRKRDEVSLTVEDARPWLYGAALNVIRNQKRSMRRQRAALVRLPEPLSSPDFSDDVDGRLDDEQRMQTILAGLKHLPNWQRDVIMLCDWGGLSNAEAALALKVEVGTVKSRLSRARAELRAFVEAGDE